MKKKCTKCNQVKHKSEFYKNKSKLDNLDNNCKKCKYERMKIYFQSPQGKAAIKRARR